MRIKILNSLILGFYLIIVAPICGAQSHHTANCAQMAEEVLVYINAYRLKQGLIPLTMNAQMSQEATQHSRDMATHKMSFGHQGFNARIKRLYASLPQCRGGAENVAYNYKDANDVVKNWLTSPGHRRNIVGHYNLTGVGIARDSKGKIYFTQIFLRSNT